MVCFSRKKKKPYMKVEVPPTVMFKAHCMLEVANLGWTFDSKIFSGNQTSTNCYDLPYFSRLSYPSLPTPGLVSFDLKPTTRPAAPPVIFPSATPPELMGKTPLPLNPPSQSPLEDLPPKPEWTRPTMPEQTQPTTRRWTSPSQVVME